MSKLSNKVLKKEDLLKIGDTIKKNLPIQFKEEKVESYQDIYKLCEKLIIHSQKKITILIKSPVKGIKIGLIALIKNLNSIISYTKFLNDSKALKKATGILIKLKSLNEDIKNKEIIKVSELKLKLGNILILLKTLSIDEDKLSYLEEQVSIFTDLKFKKVRSKDPAFMINAPLILIQKSVIVPSIMSRLDKAIGLKKLGYFYSFIKKANFIVINTKKFKEFPIKDYVNSVLKVVNKNIPNPVTPLFEVEKTVGDFCIIWIVSKTLSEDIGQVLDKISSFEIRVN